jgi:RNA polymerase sigma factor for flagellar operon FliA
VSEQQARLVREGYPVLQYVAKQLSRRLGRHIALDDLIALGHPALMEVARTYQPDRAKFSTYTALKVKWAILDGVRRETRGRSAGARAAAIAISERLNEDAAAMLAESGVPVAEEECQGRLRELLEGQAAALALGLTASRDDAIDAIPDSVDTPEESVARQELRRDIRRAVEALPDRERALIERHYFGGEPFDEIAKELGVSKSWASRLHTQAIQALAKALRGSSD